MAHRGTLTVFISFAHGVGKSFHLFEEARRLRARGDDVVFASVQSHVPLDLPWLFARRPQACVVDALAAENPPGHRHAHRYEDVEELLNADIAVFTAINIDEIEEQQPFVEQVTGRVRKPGSPTVPQRLIERADAIAMIDAAPYVLLAKAGVAFGPEFAERARQLSQLRRRTRQLTAQIVARQLDAYLSDPDTRRAACFVHQHTDRLCDRSRHEHRDACVHAVRAATSETTKRGRLKVLLSYAAGVGKTFHMLVEGHRLKREGVDVVIAFFNPHAYGRQDTITLTHGLESVPAKRLTRRGIRFTDMDPEAVIRRRPAVALVDELPHTNAPGSARAKRWDDVRALLDAGIDVVTTMNVQHLEGLKGEVCRLTGVRMVETVPDAVLSEASEMVMVDLEPRLLLDRLRRGSIYPPLRARAALSTFFKEAALVGLRELARRYASQVVGMPDAFDDDEDAVDMAARPRVLLLIEPDPAAAVIIHRARQLAESVHADCFAVCVSRTGDLRELTDDARETVERLLDFARGLQMDARVLEGNDVVDTVLRFARLHDARHLLVCRDARRRTTRIFQRGLVQRLVRSAPGGLQIVIV